MNDEIKKDEVKQHETVIMTTQLFVLEEVKRMSVTIVVQSCLMLMMVIYFKKFANKAV